MLAAEGAHVVVNGRTAARVAAAVASIRESVPRAHCEGIAADVGSAEGCARVAAELAAVDILVNNAGIFHAAPIGQLTVADFDDTMAINLRAVFVASKAAAAQMGEGGRIISIGSNLAERVPGEGFTIYSASKAALVGFTKALARDLGPRGITVNVVHPGSTDTDMNPAEGEHADAQRSLMAIQRFGRPEDIAALVAWLAGPESRFVTGAGIVSDHGANA
jgi:NAD(P)-dependent dehydrogenase (short-subunit alcohol dehydrogenase family)